MEKKKEIRMLFYRKQFRDPEIFEEMVVKLGLDKKEDSIVVSVTKEESV